MRKKKKFRISKNDILVALVTVIAIVIGGMILVVPI